MPRVAPADFIKRAAFSESIINQKMTENMITAKVAYKKMGISSSGFYAKKRQPDTFYVGELAKLAEIIGMSDEDIVAVVRGKRRAKAG